MKIDRLIIVLLTILSVAFATSDAKASYTVATFFDPSNSSSNPLFNVNFTTLKLTGGWDDSKTGLTLQVPCTDHNYPNAWFNLTSPTGAPYIGITNTYTLPWGTVGQTGPGVVKFYKDGTSTNPLIVVGFDGGVVSMSNFGASELTANTVTITGSEISGTLTQEEFSFSFANTVSLPNNGGFTATASFTSSAVPEPATIGLLCLGALKLVTRKGKNIREGK
ncbi:MAG: PEP-CTERM sorting domain-containing protein [Sedimentisphaerales bacterium]